MTHLVNREFNYVLSFYQGQRPGAGQACRASVSEPPEAPPGFAARCFVQPGPDQPVCGPQPGHYAGHHSQQPPHV